MADGLRWDGMSLLKGLATFPDRFDMAVFMFAQTGAQKMRNYAQANAPWTDRTGEARRRLNTDVVKHPGGRGYYITLAHGVDYGIWLEVANEKRFAIIESTIIECGQKEIIPGFKHLLNRMQAGV